jgi:hypothetical protein
MPDVRHVYEDEWGEIIDRPSSDLVELRWFDSTAQMSAGQFNRWLSIFADQVGRLRRSRVLVDSTQFLMNPANLDGEWRDAQIIPRYNAAGVAKFAFHFPPGMPAVGSPPAVEAPGKFATGYFDTRRAALDWLAS